MVVQSDRVVMETGCRGVRPPVPEAGGVQVATQSQLSNQTNVMLFM